MKKNNLLIFSLSIIFFGCATLKQNNTGNLVDINVSVDLVDVNDDKVKVVIDPPKISDNEIIFYIPQIIPGTYEYSNFGRFIENIKAFDYQGNELPLNQEDENTWSITEAKKLDKITYLTNDTFDGPDGKAIYPMGGTNYKKDVTFLLNLHSMIGYFGGMKEKSYKLSIRSPKNLEPFTSLSIFSKSDTLDIFSAKRYFHIIDNPILYSESNAVSFDLDNIKVGLAIYSPSGTHKAEDYQDAIEKMMIAQKNFLGDANNTASYDILLHLMRMEDLQYFGGMMGALEHHTSTTVVFADAMGPGEITQNLIDVVSHEFFHTLTPLNVHSEEIHNFEYNRPLMSKHLWMYEGTTEYFANLFQINQGLIESSDFYNRIIEKVNLAKNYDDTMSFTEMSAGIVNEPYQSNYGNVYQKGTLINMCLDILIREKSGGAKGILWVMKNLAKKYGKERPFKDDQLIEEINSMTYPEVGEFFDNHIIGTTPIDYNYYFRKVGLIDGEVKMPLRSIIFSKGTQLFFSSQPNPSGKLEFIVNQLNQSIEKIGVQIGDVLLGINGELFPEINQENSEKINQMLTKTFGWDEDKQITLTVKRNDVKLNLTGKVGKPTYPKKGILEDPNADIDKINLRNSWMFK